MTVEIQTDPSREIATSKRIPVACRHGERGETIQRKQEGGDESIFPLLSPPTWPRVFPGL